MPRAVAFCSRMRAACTVDETIEPCPFIWAWLSTMVGSWARKGLTAVRNVSSPLRHTSLSDDSSSRSAAANDSGYASMPDDKICDVMDCAERFPKKRLPPSHSALSGLTRPPCERGRPLCIWDAYPFRNAAACNSQPSHIDSSHNSSSEQCQ